MTTVAAHYAWTIRYPERQDIQKVTTLDSLENTLRILQLPGLTPAEFVTIEVETSPHGTYTHNQDGDDEWSLTWTKVDERTTEH